MQRQLKLRNTQKEILASLEQKTRRADLKIRTKLVAVREKNNELIDQIFESIFTIATSYVMSAIGFKTAAYYINSSPRAAQWIADEKDAAALPWMISFIRALPALRRSGKYNNPIELFHAFQKALTKWDHKIAGMSFAERTRIYGVDNELLIQGIALDLSQIIDTKDSYWLQKFYKYGEYANRQGVFNFELKFAYLLTFSVPFIRHLIIEPAIKPVFHKIYNLRFSFDTPLNELSQIKAQNLILSSEKEGLLLKKFSKAGIWLNYCLALSALTMAVYGQEDGKWPSPELMIYMSATIIKVFINQLKSFNEVFKQNSIEKKLGTIVKSYKDLLAFTQGDIELYRGQKFSDSYITFRAKNYGPLSAGLVNQVVKNAFLKINVPIVEYTKTTVSFGIHALTEAQVDRIHLQIKEIFEIRKAIKLFGPTNANRTKFLSASLITSPATTSTLALAVENNETDELAKKYFRLLKRNDEVKTRHLHINEVFEKVKTQLRTFRKEDRFAKIQLYRLYKNIHPQYAVAKGEEVVLLRIIKRNPTKVTTHDKKAHMHIVKSFDTIEKYLQEILVACENHQNLLKAKQQLHVSSSTAREVAVRSAGEGALFSPSAQKRMEYNQKATNFAYKLLTYCDFLVDESALGKNIQIHALLFEIVDFMKIRAKTHAQIRKDPSENFSKYIGIALSHSKNLISENLSVEALIILHADTLELSRALINAVSLDNYDALETNNLCARILKHGRELEDSPEIISDDDTITYTLITGALIQTFKTYDSPLPEGMLLSAFLMVNLKAKIYDGYVQPTTYLEYLAQPRSYSGIRAY